ncbi:MAG: response regulator, partial [Acidobacteriota bacterium]|nr:response regulator [Acidobacteriota bacterium]
AADARSGLERARRARPDVVLLDLHLPHLDGAEVLRQLRADSSLGDLRVVVVTADVGVEALEPLREAGVDGVLTKPLEVRQVLGLIDGLLAP